MRDLHAGKRLQDAERRTLLLAILDEASFLHSDAAAASDVGDSEGTAAGTGDDGRDVGHQSSPYRRSGLVYELHRDFFGVDSDDVLVVAGPSIAFNPTLNLEMIEAAAKDDPRARGLNGSASFAPTCLSSFLTRRSMQQSIVAGRWSCRRSRASPIRHLLMPRRHRPRRLHAGHRPQGRRRSACN